LIEDRGWRIAGGFDPSDDPLSSIFYLRKTIPIDSHRMKTAGLHAAGFTIP
jgi:hypothetical protein